MNNIEKEEYVIEPLETTVNSDKTNIDVEQSNELKVTGNKKEYSIIGDGLYAGINSENAPTWLTSIIDNVVSGLIGKRVKDLDTAINNINKSLLELEVAKNQYQELINIDSRIDSVLASKLETLNATIQQNSSNIIGLDTAKVTPDEALAISTDHVNAQISNGDIQALVTDINSTIANNDLSAAQRINTLESVYNENESTVREILSNSAGEYTATANAVTELEVAINEGIYGETGLENTLKGEITDEGARVESKFAYNSIIGIDGVYKKSGFGLTTNYTSGSGTEADPYLSEFWIDASRFKFTNSNQTGSVAPFTIDATGVTPQIKFNGVVDFTNTNAANGLPATTRINGGLIETNTITADRINTVGLIAENISADEIVGKTITGAVIDGARIKGAVIKASYLDLDGEMEVLTDYHITVSMYNANPALYSDAVYIDADNEYRIPTLSSVIFPIVASTDLYQNQEISGGVFAYNQANKNSNLKARKRYPYFVNNGEWDLYSNMVTSDYINYIGTPKCEVYLGTTMLFRVTHSYPNIVISTPQGNYSFEVIDYLVNQNGIKEYAGSFSVYGFEFNVYGLRVRSSGGTILNTVDSKITMKPFGGLCGIPWEDSLSFRIKSFFSYTNVLGSDHSVHPGVAGAKISSSLTINNMI